MSVAGLAALLLAGCAGGPRPVADAPGKSTALGERIAASATSQLGRPYRYGGNGPDAFDCSGLVRFAHGAQGIGVPRTTEEQFAAAKPVPLARIQAGDLLFFRFEKGPKVSHVGIYTGKGRFVHAPQSGRSVETQELDEPWYRSRLIAAGRLH